MSRPSLKAATVCRWEACAAAVEEPVDATVIDRNICKETEQNRPDEATNEEPQLRRVSHRS